MIAQILSRSFLIKWLDKVQDELEYLVSHTDDTSGDLVAALDAIAQVREFGIAGQPDDGDESEMEGRRGLDDESALDEQSFFSRDPVMSLLQSALELHFETAYPDLIIRDDDRTDRRGGYLEPAVITDTRLDDTRLDIDGVAFDADRMAFWGQFEQTDVRWLAEQGLARALKMFREPHPFNPRPAEGVRLHDRARLVIVGDWGTGLPRAQRVAQHMQAAISDGLSRGRQIHVIHLGDVYYSGWPREYRKRFLPYWPVKPDESKNVYSWSINGNHDMYSGGYGYFQTLLADPRFAAQQRSSWFAIENAHWRIVGLDTAWDEQGIHDPRTVRGLQDPQAATLQDWAAKDDKPFMLLSHHQPFSSYQTPGAYLRTKLAPLLDKGRIRAWFWGHEHKCVVHQPYAGVEYGRCVGHGGVPVYAVGQPKHAKPQVDWVEQGAVNWLFRRWAVFGFAVADFEGPDVVVSYFNEHGALRHGEAFSAR